MRKSLLVGWLTVASMLPVTVVRAETVVRHKQTNVVRHKQTNTVKKRARRNTAKRVGVGAGGGAAIGALAGGGKGAAIGALAGGGAGYAYDRHKKHTNRQAH